jgi:hypothetical protein
VYISLYYEGTYSRKNPFVHFSLDMDNWSDPVLPWPPGCPVLETESDEFTEQGRKWVCI